MDPSTLREKFKRFRILIVGRANSGKTTILQRICNTHENPEIYNSAGKKIDPAVWMASRERGIHDIENGMVSRSNPGFIFHDSRGFEAGGESEFDKVKAFIASRSKEKCLSDRIHVIWYCIPMDEYSRFFTGGEVKFFTQCDTGSIPVMVLLTKFDALYDVAFAMLREEGVSRKDAKTLAPQRAREAFANEPQLKLLYNHKDNQRPPRCHIYLANMDKDDADCGPLIERTAEILDSFLFGARSPSYPVFKAQVSNFKILAMNATARNACIAGNLSTAEELLTRDISTCANIYSDIYEVYANRSLVMARKHDWDHALEDAIKSVTIRPSLTGYISKGIALCGKGQVLDAKMAFDLAFMFTNEDSNVIHFLLLIKAAAIFNANQHEEAIIRVQSLAAACPHNDILACRVVEAYLHLRLGVNASNDARHSEAADYFTHAISLLITTSSYTAAIADKYEDLVMLFGWDLKSLWQDAHQNRCDGLLRAGKTEEALDSYRSMMDVIDENAKARCLDWSNAFMQEYSELHLASGNAALAARDYDRAIALYSVAIDLNSGRDIIFANRGKAKLEKMLWEDALLDAQKAIELSPSFHVGYEVKHAALRGAQRYDEAMHVFKIMLSKLNNIPEALIRELHQHYTKAEDAIQGAIQCMELQNAPLRLLNTSTGLLCDRGAQISAFKTSRLYNELLLSTMMDTDFPMERIADTVTTYFYCVMLSHRWGEKEPLLHDIKDKAMYELKEAGSFMKLQSFCNIARRAGYHWAWVDTCCIDQNNHVELQKSLNSMFTWYHHSALTIVYLSDVLPSSESGALAKSAWNTRGWTVPEFLAPKVIRFYQQDWTPYLNDVSPNHKESAKIMHELEGATGIDARALVTFQPGMRDARQKLQWASTRVTTLPEDIAYSLFGIFGIQLPILYGENKQRALGRLLQEIVAQSGDITALDWVGQPSTFNSCLPAIISSYAAPPCTLPSLSEEEIQTTVSSLQHTIAVDLALKLYDQLYNIGAPRFWNCRLHLPCIIFRVTEVRRKAQMTPFKYRVKANGLDDLVITTEETLIQFSRTRPTRQTFLLIRPWDRRLLELPDFADDTESMGDFSWSEHESLESHSHGDSPVEGKLLDSESRSRALQLIVRLGQPFAAFLLAQQRSGEYKRIASDQNIIAQTKDVASIHTMMDVRTLEIL